MRANANFFFLKKRIRNNQGIMSLFTKDTWNIPRKKKLGELIPIIKFKYIVCH